MKCLIPLLATGLLTTMPAFAQTSHPAVQRDVYPEEIETVQTDVRKIVHAAFAGEIDVMLDYTHPAIINAMGGRLSARQTLRRVIEQVQSLDMSLESFSFPAEPIFVLGEDFRYVIVPTMTRISAADGKIESVNFQFGIQNQDTGRWVYFEGSQLTDQILASLFADFPTDFVFPESYQTRLENKNEK